jgi:type IV secretion/conjugal transfer VirB4 family ATPase
VAPADKDALMPKDYRTLASLGDVLPYAHLLERDDLGIVLQKDGAIHATWGCSGPDQIVSSGADRHDFSSLINQALLPFGDGWLFHFTLIRSLATGYPPRGAFPDATSALIDEERRVQHETQAVHFASRTYITATYLPPSPIKRRLGSLFFVGGPAQDPTNWEEVLDTFSQRLRAFEDQLSSAGIRLSRLHGEALVQHLHECVTGETHPIRLPPDPTSVPLDFFVSTKDVQGSLDLKIGEEHVHVVSVYGFPRSTFADCLDPVFQIPAEYRLSVRWLPQGDLQSAKTIDAKRRDWAAKRSGARSIFASLLNRSGADQASVTNLDAAAMAEQAVHSQAQAASGAVRFGYYNCTLVMRDADHATLDENSRMALRRLKKAEFLPPQLEHMNCLEAFLGSLPGVGRANAVKLLVHSLHVANTVPLTTAWGGHPEAPCPYYPPGSPPLMRVRTHGSAPFNFNLHVADVGHALALGGIGGGKSVLLGAIATQILRYKDAQVFFFDRGRSSWTLAHAMGGAFYELGPEGQVALAPYRDLDSPDRILWAQTYSGAIVQLHGVDLTPERREEIRSAISRLAASPPDQRTMTELQITLQDRALRSVFAFYTEGAGRVLNAQEDTLGKAAFQVFETETFIKQPPTLVAPVLLYLFEWIARRVNRRRPTLALVDEAHGALSNPIWSSQLGEWLRLMRKENAAVILATQSPQEVLDSPLAALLLQNCPTRIFLPDSGAETPLSIDLYRRCGLRDPEIALLKHAQRKRDYLVVSPEGTRLIDLELGDVARAFIMRNGPDDRTRINALRHEHGQTWPAAWLAELGREDWAKEWQRIFEEKRR